MPLEVLVCDATLGADVAALEMSEAIWPGNAAAVNTLMPSMTAAWIAASTKTATKTDKPAPTASNASAASAASSASAISDASCSG